MLSFFPILKKTYITPHGPEKSKGCQGSEYTLATLSMTRYRHSWCMHTNGRLCRHRSCFHSFCLSYIKKTYITPHCPEKWANHEKSRIISEWAPIPICNNITLCFILVLLAKMSLLNHMYSDFTRVLPRFRVLLTSPIFYVFCAYTNFSGPYFSFLNLCTI